MELEAKLPLRKRGRPKGKGRVPLSLEERRARNAHYERERRIETAAAMAELAEAAGCHPDTPNAEIVATAVNVIQKMCKSDLSEDLETLKSTNRKLKERLQSLKYIIATESVPEEKKPIATDHFRSSLTISDDDDETDQKVPTNKIASNMRIEVAPKPEPIAKDYIEFVQPAPIKPKRGRKKVRPVKQEPMQTTPSFMESAPIIDPLLRMPSSSEFSPPSDFMSLEEFSLFEDRLTVTNENFISGPADLELLETLQASNEAETKLDIPLQSDDGVLDFMRQWSVEDFVFEYL